MRAYTMAEDFPRSKSKRPVEQPIGIWLIILWQGFSAALIPILFLVMSLVKPSAAKSNVQDPWVMGVLTGCLITLGICVAAGLRYFWARYALAALVAYGCVVKLSMALSSASEARLNEDVFSGLILQIPFRLVVSLAAVLYLLAGSTSKSFFARGR
jgi:hypothetical protein